MIEFSDFQCPYCQRAHATVEQVLSTYGDRIHFVYRHYPVPGHPAAKPAAEASECAKEQGKFWPFHDRLFANTVEAERCRSQSPRRAPSASTPLRSTPASIRTSTRASSTRRCRDGEAAGVNGTPAFYINGRMISGAQPFDVFKRIIDEELELKSNR